MTTKNVLRYGLMAAAMTFSSATAQTLDLSGEWRVDLPGDAIDGMINLPATTDIAGYGVTTDYDSLSQNEKFRRLTRKHSFVGNAVYTREIDIPKEMAHKPLELLLERVIWKSKAKIDGIQLKNTEYSLVAPHRHVLEKGLPAGKHIIEIDIDNSKQYDISTGNLAHAYTNDTQTMWNGMLGDLTLRAIPPCEISGIEVYPSDDLLSVDILVNIDNFSGKKLSENLKIAIPGNGKEINQKVKLNSGSNTVKTSLPAEGLKVWDEFNPQVYNVDVSLSKNNVKTATFGLRSVDNTNGLRVNGKPVFLRGTLECCVFPLTGVPPTDKKGWLKTFSTAKEWGLNHFRFHSWCPPEAAFEVADSLGFYLQVELPVWSLNIGDDPEVEKFLKQEFEKIVENYGNHPSFLLMSVGNELQHDFNVLNEMVRQMKNRDPRHLYTTTSFTFEKGHGGHPEPEDEFFITQWTDNGWVRGQGIFENEPPTFNKNYTSATKDVNVPLISHEIGQYAVFPSIQEIEKYSGVLDPLNFKAIKDDLIKKRLVDKADDMTLASGKFASLLYKEEIERVLKTPGMSGFQLLGLQDFPGQGTALVGLVDAFWDNKNAAQPSWFSQFTAPIVPLLNYEDAVYSASSNFVGEALVANYSGEDIPKGNIEWSLTIEGNDIPFKKGMIPFDSLKNGLTQRIGAFNASLSAVTKPSAVTAKLRLPSGYENTWKIFVFPDSEAKNDTKIVCTRSIDDALIYLSKGKKVLFSPAPDDIDGLESKFLPVFWSPVHFPNQAGTMGIMNDPHHKALKAFPNDGHSDWQWWRLVKNAKVINMDSLNNIEPIVGVIDNFVNNRKLAYIFEAKCGDGMLLFSALDVLDREKESLESKTLKASLLDYMDSDAFDPKESIASELLRTLVPGNVRSVSSKATDIYE